MLPRYSARAAPDDLLGFEVIQPREHMYLRMVVQSQKLTALTPDLRVFSKNKIARFARNPASYNCTLVHEVLFFFKLFTYNFHKQIMTATFAGGGDYSFVWLFIIADKARARGKM